MSEQEMKIGLADMVLERSRLTMQKGILKEAITLAAKDLSFLADKSVSSNVDDWQMALRKVTEIIASGSMEKLKNQLCDRSENYVRLADLERSLKEFGV